MASGMDMIKVKGDTELIKMNRDKHKYIHTTYEKVNAKMYDYHCDVKLKVSGQIFRAHKKVLSESSDYFEAMFSHNMLEKEQGEIELYGLTPCGFTAMMDYFYHGHISITSENIEGVIEAARFFHIDWLINVCNDFLIRQLSLENYHTVMHLADKFCLGDLRMDIFRFVSMNFVKLFEQTKFSQLSYELLYQLLGDDFYIEAPEGFIFHAMLEWLKADEEDRTQYKVPLLQIIRYPLLEEEELQDIPEDIKNMEELKEQINEALLYHKEPSKQCLLSSQQSQVRGSRDVLLLYTAVDDATKIQYKVPGITDFFEEKIDTEFTQNLFEFTSTAVIGNFLFVAGGYDRNTYCSSPAFYRYNPRNRQWVQLSSMNVPRVSFPLAASDNGLFAVCGIEHIVEDGNDRETYLSSVEYYDPDDNLWSLLPPMRKSVFSCAAAVCDNKLYVSGGISSDIEDTVPINQVFMYNEKTESWDIKSRMLSSHQSHSMASVGKKLFVFGGYTSDEDSMVFVTNRKNEIFDVETNQWSYITETPHEFGLIRKSCAVMDNSVYLLAGSTEPRFLVRYDTEEDSLDEGIYCGQDVDKVITLEIAMPFDIMVFQSPLDDLTVIDESISEPNEREQAQQAPNNQNPAQQAPDNQNGEPENQEQAPENQNAVQEQPPENQNGVPENAS